MSIKDPSVLLLYPPEQTWPNMMCKPNGSLAYPMLAGALREIGVHVEIYDACVGNDKDDLNSFFYTSTPLPSGMLRTGVSDERILQVVRDFNFIGLTSIFSQQETMALHCARLIKKYYPDKILVSGGVNARHRSKNFFEAGFDIICTSESERTIQELVSLYRRGIKNWGEVPKILFNNDGTLIDTSHRGEVLWNLDDLPMPAWDLLPNERYWKIRRPHGGHFDESEELKYASMMTSLGCPFSCSYCHIAKEVKGSPANEIGRFRIKSDGRVLEELTILRDKIGAKQVFIEDDSIFGMKKRAIRMLKNILGLGLQILDVNGVNVIHLLNRGEPDLEVIELLREVGFRDIVLPFESANQRIIKKWCSNKWQITDINVKGLIEALKRSGIRVAANYMIGFPDESREEIMTTIEFSRKNMEHGLDASNFFLVMPLPGTPMFDYCVSQGLLPQDFQIDKMQWTKANMTHTPVPPEELEQIRDQAWATINKKEHIQQRRGWAAGSRVSRAEAV